MRGTNLAIAKNRARQLPRGTAARGCDRCRRKFLHFFPDGFHDETYLAWERDYKVKAHNEWVRQLSRAEHERLLQSEDFAEVALRAVRIESRTNLLFSFEKMALRDAVKPAAGARAFAVGLFDLLYGHGEQLGRFSRWCEVVAELPRKQTRVLTWPIATVFGFIAQPDDHIFLKPNVTKRAARQYDFDFRYETRPNALTYENYLDFAAIVRDELADLHPRDLIDVQSFLWVQGSDEYEE